MKPDRIAHAPGASTLHIASARRIRERGLGKSNHVRKSHYALGLRYREICSNLWIAFVAALITNVVFHNDVSN